MKAPAMKVGSTAEVDQKVRFSEEIKDPVIDLTGKDPIA
jgi:hypothetical protein